MMGNMKADNHYQAILTAPFGMIGVACEDNVLTGINFLAPDILPQTPLSELSQIVCKQLEAYFDDPSFRFSLPFKFRGTLHQKKVWAAISAIPCGKTRQYGELALELASSPRAVGQACGANHIPIVIPCHRVVSKAGLGGFAHHSDGYELTIKRWLLAHEQY
jgi:methylated-DNA-[protein]-cysteine S-methyltransferase